MQKSCSRGGSCRDYRDSGLGSALSDNEGDYKSSRNRVLGRVGVVSSTTGLLRGEQFLPDQSSRKQLLCGTRGPRHFENVQRGVRQAEAKLHRVVRFQAPDSHGLGCRIRFSL